MIKQAVLSFFARRIATEIYRWDRRNPAAALTDLTPELQAEYEQAATIVARQSDEAALRPALYAAADAMVAGGIDRLTPRQRAAAVALFLRGWRAMKQHLNGLQHPEPAALMRALVARDQQAGLDAQPIPSTVAIDLSTLDTPTEVM